MKNKEILLDVIGDVDETLIPDLTVRKRNTSILRWSVLGGACAAAVIACVAALPKLVQNHRTISPYDELTVTDKDVSWGTDKIDPKVTFGTTGFEGLMAYDISELDTPSPFDLSKLDTSNMWSPDASISSLPVYRNLAYTELGIAVYLSEEQMQKIAHNTASALNVAVEDTEISYVKDLYIKDHTGESASDKMLNSTYCLNAICSDNTAITVYGDGQIEINFEKQALPTGYQFSYSSTSKEEAQKCLAYLSDTYRRLLNYDHANYYSVADRTFSGEELRSYYVYDSSEDMVQNILNYDLSFSEFVPDENGNLMSIQLNDPLCASEYLGEYPIITPKEAAEQLLDGKYYSSVPKDQIRNGTITKEDIAKTELVYRNQKEAYYQPYYKFYIELDTTTINMADGLKNYGIFYVPAVASEYLER